MKNLAFLKRVIFRTRIIRTVEAFVLFIFILTCMYIRNSDDNDNFDILNTKIEENNNNYITESKETLLKNVKTSVNLDIPEETSDGPGF